MAKGESKTDWSRGVPAGLEVNPGKRKKIVEAGVGGTPFEGKPISQQQLERDSDLIARAKELGIENLSPNSQKRLRELGYRG